MVHVDSTFVVQQAGYYLSKVINHEHHSVWSNTLTIPLYVAIASFAVILFHGFILLGPVKKSLLRLGWAKEDTILPEVKGFRGRVTAHGGIIISASEVMRVLGAGALVALQAAMLVASDGPRRIMFFMLVVFVRLFRYISVFNFSGTYLATPGLRVRSLPVHGPVRSSISRDVSSELGPGSNMDSLLHSRRRPLPDLHHEAGRPWIPALGALRCPHRDRCYSSVDHTQRIQAVRSISAFPSHLSFRSIYIF